MYVILMLSGGSACLLLQLAWLYTLTHSSYCKYVQYMCSRPIYFIKGPLAIVSPDVFDHGNNQRWHLHPDCLLWRQSWNKW